LGPFAQQRTTPALACFYSATLAWNPTAVDNNYPNFRKK
jgi:hypothetical protein